MRYEIFVLDNLAVSRETLLRSLYVIKSIVIDKKFGPCCCGRLLVVGKKVMSIVGLDEIQYGFAISAGVKNVVIFLHVLLSPY